METQKRQTQKFLRFDILLVFLMGGFLTAMIFLGFYLFHGRYLVVSRIAYRRLESRISEQAQRRKKQEEYVLSQNQTLDIQADRIIDRTRLIESQRNQINNQNEYIVELSKVKKSSDQDLKMYAEAGKKLLKELIGKDFPQIANPDLDDWAQVNLLREWAYRNTDWGTGETLIVPSSKLNLHRLPPQAIFANFLTDKKGTFCGGASVALIKLYRMFGLTAYVYGMGDPAGFLHTVTLVGIEHRGKNIYAVEDAALNLTYTNSKSEPLDFFAMLKLLQNHKHARIAVKEGKAKSRDLIVDDRKLMESFRDLIVPESSQGQRLRSGNLKCRILINSKVIDEKFGEQIAGFLKKHQQPSNSIYLFLHPILFDGSGDTDSLSRQTHQIVQSKTVATKPVKPMPREERLYRFRIGLSSFGK